MDGLSNTPLEWTGHLGDVRIAEIDSLPLSGSVRQAEGRLCRLIPRDTIVHAGDSGDPAYVGWCSGLSDSAANARIDIRIRRLSLGNQGDVCPV